LSNGIQAVVFDISPDEYALGLVEADRTPPGKGNRRFQSITVVRNGKPAGWVYDLGPSEWFHAHAFSIPSGEVFADGRIEAWHTVGELRDIADQLRDSTKDDPFPDTPVGDWEQGYHDEADLRKRIAEKVSIFGRSFSKMRY
jgi:hypothetical protein